MKVYIYMSLSVRLWVFVQAVIIASPVYLLNYWVRGSRLPFAGVLYFFLFCWLTYTRLETKTAITADKRK